MRAGMQPARAWLALSFAVLFAAAPATLPREGAAPVAVVAPAAKDEGAPPPELAEPAPGSAPRRATVNARADPTPPLAKPAPTPAPRATFLLGADPEGLDDARESGWAPNAAQVWVGPWVKRDGWGHVENRLRFLRDAGVTPVLHWYYWGADISPHAVEHGANGKSPQDWDALATELAKRSHAILGPRAYYVVLETEFNKNGVESHAPFNDDLLRQIGIFRQHAPGAKLVLGFGSWKSHLYGTFAPAAAACDLVGFQMMRGSTQDSVAEMRATPAAVWEHLGALRKAFGKPVLLTDLALATHGGWEREQEAALRALGADLAKLRGAGLAGIVLRDVRDDPAAPTWEYYGIAERTFGLAYADGRPKPAWDDWVAAARSA